MSQQPRNAKGKGKGGRDVLVSKALSHLLRHAAEKEGVKMDSQGYANVADVVCARCPLRKEGCQKEDVNQIAQWPVCRTARMEKNQITADNLLGDFERCFLVGQEALCAVAYPLCGGGTGHPCHDGVDNDRREARRRSDA